MEISQTEKDLKAHLKEQIQFLVSSSKAYDEGFTSEAKRLANVIRILVHDTTRSTSLLKSLHKKDILFYDTAPYYSPSNLHPHLGLVMLKSATDGSSGYVPP